MNADEHAMNARSRSQSRPLKMPAGKKYRYKRRRNRITKKPQRARTAAARQPFVEVKQKESESQYSLSSIMTVHIPDAFEFMTQGDASNQMSGRWIFSKWLKQKILVDFTDNNTDTLPVTYKMVQGYCKINLNPLPDPANPQGPIPVTTAALQEHVARYLLAAYEDDLAFGDKRRFKIMKTKYVTSNPRILEQPDGTAICFRQNLRFNFNWDIMRKIRYNACTDPVSHTDFFQCNTRNWIPFVMWHKNPAGNTESGSYPTITQTSKHWFTDA